MQIKEVGAKQLVKAGALTAQAAIKRLTEKAERSGGEIGVRFLRQSKAYRWLTRR